MSLDLNAIKTFGSWFKEQGKVYQTTIIIAIAALFCVTTVFGVISIVKTVEATRYSDKCNEIEQLRKDFADYRLLSETRLANERRDCKEEVDYVRKENDNLKVEMRVMVKDALADLRAKNKEYEHQLSLNHGKKLLKDE